MANPDNGKKRLVLLDAHAILHRAYHALPDFSTAKGEPTGALYGLSAMMIKIIEDLKPDYIVSCYDVHAPTYRHEAYKEYKAGRQKADDDLVAQMKSSRNIFTAMDIPIYELAGFEADDMLGTIVEQLKGDKKSLEIIIASGDMDTLQLVSDKDVKVFTLKKGIKDTVMYDEEAVNTRFGFGPELIPDFKGLRGDPSDNIIGVKGIGDKTATILITTFGSIENIYKQLGAGHEDKFKEVGITPRIIQLLKDNKEEAEFSKMLATIRRDAPITFKLPEKTFRESLDVKKIGGLWTDLEFRTLSQRLNDVLQGRPSKMNARKASAKTVVNSISSDSNLNTYDGDMGSGIEKKGNKNSSSGEDLFSAPIDSGRAQNDLVNPDDLEKTALALWLVNSSLTNPTLDDIYAFARTEDFAKAKETVFVELDKRNLRKVYEEIELPLIPVLRKMQDRGIKIDRKFMGNLARTYHVELDRLEKKIWELAGMEFNINSPKQLGEVLFDKLGLTAKNMKKTGGGARSTRESELEKLRDLHPVVPFIFEYRELQKLLSTYIDAIPPLLDDNDRLHTKFIQTGASTGRMASHEPNIQNIPIKSDLGRAIRGAFVADKGYKLVAFDYSQIELRIAAFLSGDEKLIEIFKKGEDVHTSVASQVFKVSKNEVTSEMRRQAKVINFGIIYGMGVLALKQNLGTTRDVAQNFLNDYFETFSTLAKYLDRIKAETARKGYTETYFGRRRYFEGINSKIPYIRASAERMAINAPIQGTEADIIKIAMARVDEYIEKESLNDRVFALLQVHDELVYEIVDSEVDRVVANIKEIMESVLDPKDTSGVVMKAEAVVGKNWGELK